MSESTRPKRRYDATRRQAQAAQTRTRVVEAAQRVFLASGYARATVPAIAAEAGVAVETVYRSAAGKAGLLEAAVQAAVAGGAQRSMVPVEERPVIQRVIEESDAQRQLHMYVATQPGIWRRVGPLLRVLDEAAATDDTLRALQDQHAEQRLQGMRRFAALLSDRGSLRPGLSTDQAADILWTLCARANYDALVTSRGWTHSQYRDWLTDALAHALLADPRARGQSC